MFENIDFKSGNVRYCSDCLSDEDILTVIYPKNYVLELGYYESREVFVLNIVKDNEWSVPVVRYTICNADQIESALKLAIQRIDKAIPDEIACYGGLWKTEEITM